MLIFSYYRISQQLTLNWRLTDWRLSTPICYPDFSHTSLYNNTLHKYSDYRLVRVKICWPRNNPATALSWRIQGNEPPTWSSCLHCSTVLSVMLIFYITVFYSNLRWTGDLQIEGCRRLSVILIFRPPRCITILYTNIPITDSSGWKYADRGITLPQLFSGAFKEMSRRREVLVCIVLPFCLLCSFFHIPVFHSDLRWAVDLQTEGCRWLSVIPTFHLPRCMTTLYANITITDSSRRKYAERRINQPQLFPDAFIMSTCHSALFCLLSA